MIGYALIIMEERLGAEKKDFDEILSTEQNDSYKELGTEQKDFDEKESCEKKESPEKTHTIHSLKEKFIDFRDKRDWKQYHLPKDLAIALSIEAGEILEHFRFKTHEEILEYIKDQENKKKLSHELADVFMYLLVLANETGIDLAEAFHEKQKINEARYPVEVCKGKPNKYSDYEHNNNNQAE